MKTKSLNSSNLYVTQHLANTHYLSDNSVLLGLRALTFEFLKISSILLIIIFTTVFIPVKAQVNIFIPDTVRQVGDELSLTLSYNSPTLEQVRFPQINSENFSGIEFFPVIPKTDTIQINGNYSQRITYKFAVYDAGEYTVPPLPFYINPNNPNGQIVYSDTFKFTVSFPVVDTTADIRDIAPIEKIGFGERFAEFLKSNWLTISIIALLVALITAGILYYLKRRKDEPMFLRPKKPALSPRQAALRALKELHEKKLWQQNAIKEYYTVLTDILRQYLDTRYNIPALEMTSDELLDAFGENFPSSKNTAQDFRFVLTTADLAKFAKSTPLPSDNETCYAMVLRYVEAEAEVATQAQQEEEQQEGALQAPAEQTQQAQEQQTKAEAGQTQSEPAQQTKTETPTTIQERKEAAE